MGESPTGSRLGFKVTPTLGQLDATWARAALRRIDEAVLISDDGPEPDEIIGLHDLAARGLLRLGRTAEAIARWQLVLDTFPKHPRYREHEAKLLTALGVIVLGNLFARTITTFVFADESLTVYTRMVAFAVGGQLIWRYLNSFLGAHQRFGRIAVANSDAGASATTESAIDQGWRAVQAMS